MEEDAIQLRRQIIDWRDKHVENTYQHLNRELNTLFADIDNTFNKMDLSDIFKNKLFFKRSIEPIYLQWVENESAVVINNAQHDLNGILQHTIEHTKSKTKLNYKDDKDSLRDVATASLTTGAAIAAIPTLITLSTTTVSAGGLLGLVGITSTAISWPVVLVGGTLLLGLSHFGIDKASNLKSAAKERLRKKIQQSIRDRVVFNKEGDSVCQLLQLRISEVSKTLLSDLTK